LNPVFNVMVGKYDEPLAGKSSLTRGVAAAAYAFGY
jgi:hypothetical protein